jgi:hypothetical protein
LCNISEPVPKIFAMPHIEPVGGSRPMGTIPGPKRHCGDGRRPKKGEEKAGNASFSKLGTTRATTLARLDRDGLTELAAKVRAGKISAPSQGSERPRAAREIS